MRVAASWLAVIRTSSVAAFKALSLVAALGAAIRADLLQQRLTCPLPQRVKT